VTRGDHAAGVAVVVSPRGLDTRRKPAIRDRFAEARGALRALLGRNRLRGADVLHFGDLRLDPDTREVRRGRRRIELTPIEFSLLELLLRNPGRVLERSAIFSAVWGFDFGATSNSLTVYIGNLRRKTEAGGEPRLIHTVRGVGYVLREPRTPPARPR
jgi:two-component system response regulator MprA